MLNNGYPYIYHYFFCTARSTPLQKKEESVVSIFLLLPSAFSPFRTMLSAANVMAIYVHLSQLDNLDTMMGVEDKLTMLKEKFKSHGHLDVSFDMKRGRFCCVSLSNDSSSSSHGDGKHSSHHQGYTALIDTCLALYHNRAALMHKVAAVRAREMEAKEEEEEEEAITLHAADEVTLVKIGSGTIKVVFDVRVKGESSGIVLKVYQPIPFASFDNEMSHTCFEVPTLMFDGNFSFQLLVKPTRFVDDDVRLEIQYKRYVDEWGWKKGLEYSKRWEWGELGDRLYVFDFG